MASSLLKQAQKKLGPQVQALASEQGAPKNGVLPLVSIIVRDTQVRKEFEDADNPLKELAADIKARGVLQPILVRPIQGGQYELIAGERRYRAATLAGLKEIPVLVKAMTDEEAQEAQFIENIHRKNLTLQEQAARIKQDLDANGGDVQAVLRKYNKPESGRAWVSKMVALLDLPEQTQRLVSEDISADTEVILAVKRLEKVDSKKAEEVVEELKAARTKGQGVARKTVAAAKAEIDAGKGGKRTTKAERQSEPVQEDEEPAQQPTENASITVAEIEAFYQKGLTAEHWYDVIAQGIRDGEFDGTPVGNLRLLAFSQGYEKVDNFSADALLKDLQ